MSNRVDVVGTRNPRRGPRKERTNTRNALLCQGESTTHTVGAAASRVAPSHGTGAVCACASCRDAQRRASLLRYDTNLSGSAARPDSHERRTLES